MLIIKQKTWRSVLVAQSIILGIFALILIYHIAVGTFSGVDGGFGLATGLAYLVAAVIYIVLLHLVRRITVKRPRVNTVTFIIAIIIPIAGLFAAGSYFVQENIQSTRLEKITPAFQGCTITNVEWQYSPAKTHITYSDQPAYTSNEYISPTIIDGLVSKQESKCGTSIEYLVNGEVPSNRKWNTTE
jgi:multisubunit Na+/H+ antiporter MnhB subunit